MKDQTLLGPVEVAPTLIAQRLPGRQHMAHARLRQRLAAQAKERFALQIEQILLADLRPRRRVASGEHMRQLAANTHVMRAEHAAQAHTLHGQVAARRALRVPPRGSNFCSRQGERTRTIELKGRRFGCRDTRLGSRMTT